MADISYSKINWENEPSHNTPLSAQNLNKMDTAIDELVEKSNSLKPNPTGTPTEGLEKLEYDGTVYEVKGGHKVLDDSGTLLAQKDNLQFKGVYSHNVGDNSEVDIVREFQSKAEIEALTGEAKKGFEVIEDTEEYIPYTGSDILFDNTDTSFEGENVQEVLEEVDGKIENLDIASHLEFEVGQFPITYGSSSGNVTGVKITSTGNNRHTIIGTEIAGGTLNMGAYVYNSWNDITTRIDRNEWKLVGVITTTTSQTLPTGTSEILIVGLNAGQGTAFGSMVLPSSGVPSVVAIPYNSTSLLVLNKNGLTLSFADATQTDRVARLYYR